MPDESAATDAARLRRERDLYLRLLNVGINGDPGVFLKDALALMVEVAGAHQGYLELYGESEATPVPRWCLSHGFSGEEVEEVRGAVSRGIIAEAVATGRTIVTPSAISDTRFRDRRSVLNGQIEAVVCAPIGEDPPRGVIYLQRRVAPGAFPEDDRAKVELFAHHLVPLADRLLHRNEPDPTRNARASLRLDGVIGSSPVLAALLRQVALVAPLEVIVLLTGDSGTGKSVIARAIHENSPRAGGPFVEVNCGALPETLIENELFGSLPGAHSTARVRLPGKVVAAERGTLLLDEVGDLSPSAQAKLLQLLQSNQYYPLGASRPVQADVRVLAATNTDLQLAVREHRFREDLLYRLQVVPIRMPTLAERREDIGPLAAWFCAGACERHRLPRLSLSHGAVRSLEMAEWPGNIRQLAHAVEAAVIRAAGEGAQRVERSHVFADQPPPPQTPTRPTFQEATRHFQAHLLRETLEETGWNIMETAQRLDLARSHVYNLIRAFGLGRERK